MSYDKKTWAPKDKITSTALNNIEAQTAQNETLHVPFTISVDPSTGAMSATTTEDYATVRAAALTGRTVIADVTAPGNMTLRIPMFGYNDTELFFAIQFMPNAGDTAAEYYSVYWSAEDILLIKKTVPLT